MAYDKGFKETIKKAEDGDISAMLELGYFWSGSFDFKIQVKGGYWYTKAVEFGSIKAMCDLAWCYMNGVGVEIDFEKAKVWLNRVAEEISLGNAGVKRFEAASYKGLLAECKRRDEEIANTDLRGLTQE